LGEPLLSLQGIAVAFGALRAVDGVSLSIAAGERRAIIGPNGAGKTTLFNAIAGDVRVTEGAIRLEGRDITGLKTHRRAALGIGRTFQITTLFMGLTVEENVRLAVRGLSSRKFAFFSSNESLPGEKERIDRVLDQSRLSGERRRLIKTLSYGQQRELELALALAGEPRLLLLDEPAAGLSPAERVTMAELIRALPRSLTVVLIEHDMELALGLADSVTCLHYGQVLVEGPPQAMRDNETVQEVYLGRRRHADVPAAPRHA
jgi:branched-chain amino acid transport system ATP-binding protein